MAADKSPWTDVPADTDTEPCICCDKPTRSHAVRLVEDPPGEFRPIDGDESAEFLMPVCHTCYREHDGDALAVSNHMSKVEDFPELDAAGLTPGVLNAAAGSLDAADPDSGKGMMSERTVTRFVERELRPGDIIEVNDREHTWVVLPVGEDDLSHVQGDIIAAVLELGEGKDSLAGGLMRSEDPNDSRIFLGYSRQDIDGLQFEPISELHQIGHSEEVQEASVDV